MLVEMKTCNKCKRELPKTTEYFHMKKDTKDGFNYTCKTCRVECERQRYKKNKESIAEQKKQYYEEHNEDQRQYRKERKEIIAKHMREYYKEHRETLREYSRQWKKENKEAVKEYSKEYDKKYSKEHRDKRNVVGQRYRTRKRQLLSTLTAEQWEKIKQSFNNKCAYCGKELPLAQEHVIPLSKGGEYAASNIVPACKSCNSSKGPKLLSEWYPKYRYYSKKREKKILDFLGYKDDKQQLSLII